MYCEITDNPRVIYTDIIHVQSEILFYFFYSFYLPLSIVRVIGLLRLNKSIYLPSVPYSISAVGPSRALLNFCRSIFQRPPPRARSSDPQRDPPLSSGITAAFKMFSHSYMRLCAYRHAAIGFYRTIDRSGRYTD